MKRPLPALLVLLALAVAGCSTEPDRDFYDVRFVTLDYGTAEGVTPDAVAAAEPTESRFDGSVRVLDATGFYADRGGEKMLDLRFGAGKALGLAVALDGERWTSDFEFDLAEGYGTRQVTGAGTLDAEAIEGSFRLEDVRPDGRRVAVLEGRFEGTRSE